ncbi:MAG: hypothetical protein ACI4TC_01265, partial [Kiritimatiellia bacterium]
MHPNGLKALELDEATGAMSVVAEYLVSNALYQIVGRLKDAGLNLKTAMIGGVVGSGFCEGRGVLFAPCAHRHAGLG